MEKTVGLEVENKNRNNTEMKQMYSKDHIIILSNVVIILSKAHIQKGQNNK